MQNIAQVENNAARTAPESLVNFAQAQLQALMLEIKGIDFVMLCSTDGFELCSAHKKQGYNVKKLAAVSSSILAMLNAFLAEMELVGCQNMTLDAEDGKAIITTIETVNYPMLMVTLTSKDVLLGQLLASLKRVSHGISLQDQRL